MNQKILTAAVIILAICTGFLMVQHFSGTKPVSKSPLKAEGEVGPKIVYVNEDTLLANYQYMNLKQEEFA